MAAPARVVREVVPQALGLTDDLFDDDAEIDLPPLPVTAGSATPPAQILVPFEPLLLLLSLLLAGIFPLKWENARQNSNLLFDSSVKGSAPKSADY